MDEDHKQRRNLMAFASLLCVAWYLRIDLVAVVVGFLKIPAGPDPTRVSALSGLLLAYLVARYAYRPDEREPLGDRNAVRAAYVTALQDKLRAHLNRAAKGVTTRDWVTPPVSFRANPLGELLRERRMTGTQIRTFSMGDSDPLGIARTGQLTISIDYLVDEESEPQHGSVTIPYVVHPTRFTLFRLTAAFRALLLSRQAINVFLPYYLAAGAAMTLIR